MTDIVALQRRAQQKLDEITRRRESERYRRVMGRFLAAGLLVSNRDYPHHTDPIGVEDAMWAAEVEPRIIELLPALLCLFPSLFSGTESLPADLDRSVRQLKAGEVPAPLRGMDGARQALWLTRLAVGSPAAIATGEAPQGTR